MVKPAEKIIFIQDHEGTRLPFDPVELQTRLINCFLKAGLRDSSYMAEDIALAVEYTLLNSARSEPVFGKGELAAAVIRMLEETGFAEVAALFRQTGGEQRTYIDSDPEAIAEFLKKFLACSPELLEQVVNRVTAAVAKLDIAEAEPHLLLELARYYERRLALDALDALDPSDHPPARLSGEQRPASPAPLKGRSAVSREELLQVLPAAARELVDEGLLNVQEISHIFSRIHFHVSMRAFAEKYRISCPATEMEVEPLLYTLSATLEEARAALVGALEPEAPLPVHLTMPDMSAFVTTFFGAEWARAGKLGRELADALAAELRDGLYKLTVH